MKQRQLMFVLNEATFFLSHRLPIALAARDDGFTVHVVTAPGPGVEGILAAGLYHHSVPMSRSGKNPFAELRTLLAFYRLFRRIRPDLVHLATIKPVLYGGIMARLARVPSVVAAVTGLGFVFVASGRRARVVRALAVAMYRVAFGKRNLKVIFQNPDDREQLERRTRLEREKATIIRGSGVDLSRYATVPRAAEVSVVVMAARLLRDKGVHEFVAAAHILAQRGVHARFQLAGDPDAGNPASVDEEDLSVWRADGVVELLGHRSDIARVFAQADIVVLPSYHEGLPKVLIEAAACGRAVVTSDVPGCRDAIEPCITGLLVPARNAIALADAIQRLLRDPDLCDRMGRAGRELAEREFSIDRVVAKHLAVYRELIAAA